MGSSSLGDDFFSPQRRRRRRRASSPSASGDVLLLLLRSISVRRWGAFVRQRECATVSGLSNLRSLPFSDGGTGCPSPRCLRSPSCKDLFLFKLCLCVFNFFQLSLSLFNHSSFCYFLNFYIFFIFICLLAARIYSSSLFLFNFFQAIVSVYVKIYIYSVCVCVSVQVQKQLPILSLFKHF